MVGPSRKGHGALLAAALLAGLVACSKSVAVAVNVVTVGCAGSPDPFNADGGAGSGSVEYLQFNVTVDGGSVLSETTAIGSRTLQVPQLPLGTMNINVEGLSSATGGNVVAAGNSGPFVIPTDGSLSQLSVTVFLRPTNAFSYTNSASSPDKACSHMVSARAYHSQALLPNGQVLIYGGLIYAADTSQPNTVDWTQALAMPPMVVPNTQYLSSAEIYNPQTGQFTAAGAGVAGDASDPANRAFTQMLAFDNGGALVAGGKSAGTPATLPASNGLAFSASPSPAWAPVRTASAHAHGCLAEDASGHALVAGGYAQLSASPEINITTQTAEFFDPTVWPPVPRVVPDVEPPPNDAVATSRADQGCSGFYGIGGLGGLFHGLALEIGGVVAVADPTDPTGVAATIDQDYFFYQFQPATTAASANFAPYLDTKPNIVNGVDAGPLILGSSLVEPRARARAAAMIVTEAATSGATALGDAVLVTGGFTCTPGLSASCSPAFAGGNLSGQLANPPYTYFDNEDGGVDVGLTTELIAFPGGTVNPGSPSTPMQVERIDHCAVPLPDGRVLVLGGLSGNDQGSFGTTNSAEVFSDYPIAPNLPSVQAIPVPKGLLQARAGMACTLLQDGSILVTGGFQTTGPLQSNNAQPVTTLNSAEIYRPLPLVSKPGG